MQKINSIILRNFKYFYGKETEYPQNKLELNGNHLLLYGENGSGKSSIYWALYTFLQSAIKDQKSEIEKYFDPGNNQNLRNRFADKDDESGIIIEFISPSGRNVKELKRKTDRTYSINTHKDTFVNKALVGSDFINYKYLTKTYGFRNSESIDLFKIFERDIFMFVDFEEAFTKHDGTLSTETYASDWWKFICEAPQHLPYNKNKVSVGSEEFKRLVEITIPRFVELLKKFLLDITQEANEYLHNEFKEDAYKIKFNTENITCEYNKRISQRARDGKLHKPTIPLEILFDNKNVSEEDQRILKPHTFLNEARLTAIALSIRLAILKRRPLFPDSARVLILDDLLLSLDMSYRDKVLDIILDQTFVDRYQIMIFTHDRAFYNICKNRINDRFDKGWVFKEMYQDETETGIPCPFIPQQRNYLDCAKKYLKEFDYPASANYLRKEAERVLKYILPKNLTVRIKDDKGTVPLPLDTLINNFNKYGEKIGFDTKPFAKLKEHKNLLMNPLSHDNIDSPIYRRELVSTISLIEGLNKLNIFTIGLPDVDNLQPFTLIEKDKDDNEWHYQFAVKEVFRAVKDLNAVWHISNPECFFVSRKNISQDLPEETVEKSISLGVVKE